jgi:hypothetical protein
MGEDRGEPDRRAGRSAAEDRGEARPPADASSAAELTQPGPDRHPVTGGPAVNPSDPTASGRDPDREPIIDLDEDDIPH